MTKDERPKLVVRPSSFVNRMSEINNPHYLMLVRHSISDQRPELPPASWGLTAEGVERCRPLAEQLAAYQPDRIFASIQPRASQTAAAIANHLGMNWTTAADLHEHDRAGDPFTSQEAFVQRVHDFFLRPNELVMGRETAGQAQTRIVTAVQSLVAQYPHETLLVVTHGTVMTLFTSYFNPIAPISFWQELQMPDFRLYSLPDYRLIGGSP